MLNMKYYRKLNREDPQKARDYRDRCIASKDTLDKHWYKTPDRWVLKAFSEPDNSQLQELSNTDYYEGYIFREKPNFDHIGHLEVVYDPAEVSIGGYYITYGYWLFLSDLIEKLREAQDAYGIYKLQQNIPVPLCEFRRANRVEEIEKMLRSENQSWDELQPQVSPDWSVDQL